MAPLSVVCTTVHRLVGASLPSNGTQALGGVSGACVAPCTCSNPHDATTQWLAWIVLLLVCCLLYSHRQR